MPAQVTIVIPAKNEFYTLPKLLTSLNRQDYRHLPDTRVYVADANSTDSTAAIARMFRAEFTVEVIAGGLPAVGRNAGARLATTPYVLFLDADVQLGDRGLLRRALETAERRRLHCVTTSIACADGSAMDRAFFAFNNVVQRASRWAAPFSTGMFMLFDRGEFLRLGGFNERAMYAEDYLLSKQVARNRFAVVPGRVVTSNRRFVKMGHGRIARMFLQTAANSCNPSYFLRERGYWQESATEPALPARSECL